MANIDENDWDATDQVLLFKKLSLLHEAGERAKAWAESKKAFIKAECSEKEKKLAKINDKILKITTKTKGAKSDKLERFLRRDKEIYKACKKKQTNEVVETIEAIIFKKRKYVDKLIYDLNQIKEDYYDSKKHLKRLKKGSESKNFDKEVKAIQEKESELESLITVRDTGLIVLNSYKKLMEVLKKESLNFDAIVSRLKGIVILRAEYLLHLLEMLKLAFFDDKSLERLNDALTEIRKEVSVNECKVVQDLKTEVVRARDQVPAESLYYKEEGAEPEFDKNQELQVKKFNRTIDQIKEKWDDALTEIRKACRVTKNTEIFLSVENYLHDTQYLQNLLHINNLIVENYTQRRDYLQQALDELIYTTPEYLIEFERRKKELLEKKSNLNRDIELLEIEFRDLSKSTNSWLLTMFFLHTLLKNIAVLPKVTYYNNNEIFRKYDIVLKGIKPKSPDTAVIKEITDGEGEDEDVNENKDQNVPIEEDDDSMCNLKFEQTQYDDLENEFGLFAERIRKKRYPSDFEDTTFPPTKSDNFMDEGRIPLIFDGIFLKVKLMLAQLEKQANVRTQLASKEVEEAFKDYIRSKETREGVRLDDEEVSEEECEREELKELEKVLISLWSKAGSSGRPVPEHKTTDPHLYD